jgi:hypothetical protein
LVYDNGARFNKQWDTIWEGRSRVTATGWQAEVAIPARSIAFAPGADAWGFNVVRERKRNNVVERWASWEQRFSFFAISEGGTLTNMTGLHAGIGIDVVPYVKVGAARQRSVDQSWDLDPDAGGDLFWRITPSLTASATLYTDFAETEVDQRQVNLTRFPLFFPEKRDFFLEDASLFEFGLSQGFDDSGRTLLPYFSRRIGLAADGSEIPILAGLKLAGRAGPWNLGLLDVVTDQVAGIDRQNLAVARVSRHVGGNATVGMIATAGTPTAPGENEVFGVDGTWRATDFLGDKTLRLSAYGLHSFSSGDGGDDAAAGVSAEMRNDLLLVRQDVEWIGKEFRADLGFVRRRGVTRLATEVGVNPRPGSGPIRQLHFGADQEVFLDTQGEVDSARVDLPVVGAELHSQDEVALRVRYEYDRPLQPFEIHPGVTIPAGEYDWVRGVADFESASGRPLAFAAGASTGGFYGGTRTEANIEGVWRPDPFLIVGTSIDQNWVELDQGDFTTTVLEGRVDFHFTPAVSLRNLAQYDTESKLIGLQTRLRWILTPGSDLFVVGGFSWARSGGSTVPEDQSLAAKLQYTFRF